MRIIRQNQYQTFIRILYCHALFRDRQDVILDIPYFFIPNFESSWSAPSNSMPRCLPERSQIGMFVAHPQAYFIRNSPSERLILPQEKLEDRMENDALGYEETFALLEKFKLC